MADAHQKPEQSEHRTTSRSASAFARATQLMPGGVSSPVRAFKGVGGTPLFIDHANGCTITDVDGNTYIDYVGSYGPMIIGHAHQNVSAAIVKSAGRGTSFGAPSELEIRLAETICGAVPSIEMIRFVNSGTEAAMSAIRLARAATGRDLIIKCIGCYHGHSDGLLVNAGSGALTLGTPSSPGVPKSIAAGTISVHYNDLASAAEAFEKYPGQIACFAVEPVAGNMGLVLPGDGYLQGLRELCDKHGALLLFDEVMSGFRVAWGGAQGHYGVKPDLTCLGKVIGGGLPVGAYGGAKHLMQQVSPSGPVYQAGTLSGNPLAMSAGIATLEVLQQSGAYEQLSQTSAQLARGMRDAASDVGLPLAVNYLGGMVCPFFVKTQGATVCNYADATACDTALYARFFHAMLDGGVYLPPSQFEAWFPSLAHDQAAVDATLSAAHAALRGVAG